MLWSFIAVCLSAWLSVDASYRGPTWQRWLFKPLTLLLLLLLAWQAPMFDAISYLVLAGLCASLLGDALTLLPRQRLMYAIGAFFLSHLLYTIYFASQMTLSFFWPLPLVLLGVEAKRLLHSSALRFEACLIAHTGACRSYFLLARTAIVNRFFPLVAHHHQLLLERCHIIISFFPSLLHKTKRCGDDD